MTECQITTPKDWGVLAYGDARYFMFTAAPAPAGWELYAKIDEGDLCVYTCAKLPQDARIAARTELAAARAMLDVLQDDDE